MSLEEKTKTITEWFKHFRDNNIPNCGSCPNPRTKESCSDCEQVLGKSPKLVRLSDAQQEIDNLKIQISDNNKTIEGLELERKTLADFVQKERQQKHYICKEISSKLKFLDYEQYHGDLKQSLTPTLREVNKLLEELLK